MAVREVLTVGGALRVATCVSLIVTLGCGKSTEPVRVPALPESFLFVIGPPGDAQIVRWYPDDLVPLTTGPGENSEPSSAAGRLAFTSYRDGNAEIYLSALDGTGQHRVISATGFDYQPDLSPDATRLAFVSTRTGVQRIYVADSSGAALTALGTGSAANVPETSPSWSPDASKIAFASSRSGSSQIYVVPVGGGSAARVTSETVGAFDPAWSAGGDTLYFVAAAANPIIRAVHIASLRTITLPAGSTGYLQPACADFGCIVIEGDPTVGGPIVALRLNGQRRDTIVTGPNRDPALIR